MNYTQDELLKTAKRLNNTRRSYLLVNPLQAKHIPVSPKTSLEMMRTLGKMLFGKYPSARLVIGFAETATAIGAGVSECFPDDCVYIHTTREDFKGSFVYFSEEHSHAVEQKLYSENLSEFISKTPQIIFIDDEISTGKTLINIVSQLKAEFPNSAGKEFVAASIINRVSEENEKRLSDAGIKTECLLKLPFGDYEKAVENIQVIPAETVVSEKPAEYETIDCSEKIPNARMGVKIGDYKREVRRISENILSFPTGADVLVLGTEECMYPAVILGEILEEKGVNVLCHSTTRSPIGINTAHDYPINSGYKLRSFYDSTRETFIYNLKPHDYAVVVTDSKTGFTDGLNDLCRALRQVGCKHIYLVKISDCRESPRYRIIRCAENG